MLGALTARRFQLGVVDEPAPGDERFTGRLCIPYLTRAGVLGLKFRCIALASDPEHSCKAAKHPKYDQPHGQPQRLYNTAACFSVGDVLGVCEGELDAITATEHLGIPAIGVPGATQWKNDGWHWQLALRDFGTVVIFGDGDEPGKNLATQIAADAGSATRVVICPDGHDINSMVVAGRGDELRRKAGIGASA